MHDTKLAYKLFVKTVFINLKRITLNFKSKIQL